MACRYFSDEKEDGGVLDLSGNDLEARKSGGNADRCMVDLGDRSVEAIVSQ